MKSAILNQMGNYALSIVMLFGLLTIAPNATGDPPSSLSDAQEFCADAPNQIPPVAAMSAASSSMTISDVRYYDVATTITVDTLTVTGVVLTAPGVDLCIQVETLNVLGKICTGSGLPGSDAVSYGQGSTGTATATPGSRGGNLYLLFVDSPLTPLYGTSMTVRPGASVCTGAGGIGGSAWAFEPCDFTPTIDPLGQTIINCVRDVFDECSTQLEAPCAEDLPPPCSSSAEYDIEYPDSENATAWDPTNSTGWYESDHPALVEHNETVDLANDTVEANVVPPQRVGCTPTIPEPTESRQSSSPFSHAATSECQPISTGVTASAADGGDGGKLLYYFTAEPTWTVLPQSLLVGNGGNGGNSFAFTDAQGDYSSHSGKGGDSSVYKNGEELSYDSPGASWFESHKDWFAGATGGDGGKARAEPLDYCSMMRTPIRRLGPICDHPVQYEVAYCAASVVARIKLISETCNEISPWPCFGAPGASDNGVGNSAPASYDGADGQDASGGESLSAGCGAETGSGAGCGASAGCSWGNSYGATAGGPGFPGVDAAWGEALAENGGDGALVGGHGGDAYAEGMQGGPGGAGGKGGDGYHGACNDRAPKPGGYGGIGGNGGSANARAGAGGNAVIQGGGGGNAKAVAGNGGTGGPGGAGGNAPSYVMCTGDLPPICMLIEPCGAEGGLGGFGGPAGTPLGDEGEEGSGNVNDGPPGIFTPVPGTGHETVRSAPGAHGQKIC